MCTDTGLQVSAWAWQARHADGTGSTSKQTCSLNGLCSRHCLCGCTGQPAGCHWAGRSFRQLCNLGGLHRQCCLPVVGTLLRCLCDLCIQQHAVVQHGIIGLCRICDAACCACCACCVCWGGLRLIKGLGPGQGHVSVHDSWCRGCG